MIRTFNSARHALRGGTALKALALMGAGLAAGGVAAPAVAQGLAAGSLSGTVVDSAGAPVGGAEVVVASSDRGFNRSTTTSTNGTFTVSQLPAGRYSVTITGKGFQPTRTEEVDVSLSNATYSFSVDTAGGARIR